MSTKTLKRERGAGRLLSLPGLRELPFSPGCYVLCCCHGGTVWQEAAPPQTATQPPAQESQEKAGLGADKRNQCTSSHTTETRAGHHA